MPMMVPLSMENLKTIGRTLKSKALQNLFPQACKGGAEFWDWA